MLKLWHSEPQYPGPKRLENAESGHGSATLAEC
jgi:hypothetical protein